MVKSHVPSRIRGLNPIHSNPNHQLAVVENTADPCCQMGMILVKDVKAHTSCTSSRMDATQKLADEPPSCEADFVHPTVGATF